MDKCLWCQGVWFDAGELEAYRAALPPRSGDGTTEGSTFERTPTQDPVHCPHCPQQPLIIGKAGGIEIGKCDRCRSVFVSGEQMAELNYDTTPDSMPHVINILLSALPWP